jgi:glycosyltransferase involved in cell wall biosynthesis
VGHHLKQIIIRAFIKRADLVLYSCTGNQLWFEHLGVDRNKMTLIPCSVDNDFFRIQHNLILSRGESPKKQLGLDDNVLYIVSVARMHSNKRLLDIIEAVGVLQKKGFSVGLLLVGDGPQRRQIEQRVQELDLTNVHLTGFVNMSQISAYYAAADLFVLASEYDPSPKALSEALIFSLSAVCTDTIGTAGDLVVDGENGFLYPVGNLEILVDRLSIILSDQGRRQVMGHKSFEISEQWSMKAAAKSVVDAVNRLTGRST